MWVGGAWSREAFPGQIGLGGVNGDLAFRETAKAKRQRCSGHGGKVVAASTAREGNLSTEVTPDRGKLGLVTRARKKPVLACQKSLSNPQFGGGGWRATGVTEARSKQRSVREENARHPADRFAEADEVA